MTQGFLPVLAVVSVLAASADSNSAFAQLPPPPIAGTARCAPVAGVRFVRVKAMTCHRGRAVAHFWESVGMGRCPLGWSFRRYALPASLQLQATGDSYLS